MIEPDKPPTEDVSAGPHPTAKAEMEQDLVFLQRCFREALSGELENWPWEMSLEYRAILSRLADLLESQKPTYGERLAATAILELSQKISASGKARNILHQITGRKH